MASNSNLHMAFISICSENGCQIIAITVLLMNMIHSKDECLEHENGLSKMELLVAVTTTQNHEREIAG